LKDLIVPLEDVLRRFFDDPNTSESDKDNIRALMSSHLVNGVKLQQQGLLQKAIEEFSKENNRPIRSDIDKEIVQTSYFHIGTTYREMGEIEKAQVAFEKALELFRQYDVGSAPHYDLAEILLEQERFDEAILICRELLEVIPSTHVKQLLDKIMTIKRGKFG
jgi:tetratricopeptide (TPR) repeat protein